MNSIIEESRKARSRGFLGIFKKKKIIIPVIIIIIIAGAVYYMRAGETSKNVMVEKKEWTVKTDDIQIAIEADGKVVAEDGVELSFSVTGDTLEVTDVFVKEGAKISRGDKIAVVKTDTLEFSSRAAYSAYLSALATFNERQAGPTDEAIAKAKASIEQAKISLEQSKISLEKTKTSASVSILDAENDLKTAEDDLKNNPNAASSEDVNNAYEDIIDTIKSVAITLEEVLPESDEIIGVDNIYTNDAYEKNLGVKNISSLSTAVNSYKKAKLEKNILDTSAVSLSSMSSQADINAAATQAEAALNAFEEHLFDMQTMLEASITSTSLTQTQLDAFKATINTNRAGINSKITSLTIDLRAIKTAIEGLSDYKNNFDDAQNDLVVAKEKVAQDIRTSESNVLAKEISLKQTEIAYDELLAPLTEAEFASARNSLTSASINYEKTRYELEKATLLSPIDGEVAQLNYKTGDIIMKDDTKPVATIINNDTLFIEVNIEEADINKIKVGQKAFAGFDALDGLELEGEISFISLTSKSENNGIVTYLVRVIFENTEDSKIREGMTAFVDFVTSGVRGVLTAPVAAVRNVNGEPSVELANGEWRPVTTGFTDGKNVEIISGLNTGDKIVY